MSPNHPNRGRGSASRTPTPGEIADARKAAGLTQREAAALVHATIKGWQKWESPLGTPENRRMHPGLWELFRIKTARRRLERSRAQNENEPEPL